MSNTNLQTLSKASAGYSLESGLVRELVGFVVSNISRSFHFITGGKSSMKNTIVKCIFFNLFLLFPFFATSSEGVRNMYIFGDSMSDQRMFTEFSKANFGDFEKAFQGDGVSGRRSNGKNWLDYLSETTGIENNLDNNFAVVGALTSENNNFLGKHDNSENNPIGMKWNKTGILSQISFTKDRGIRFGKKDLVVLWGAVGNDFLTLMTLNASDYTWKNFGSGENEVSDAHIENMIKNAKDNYAKALAELKSMGAKELLLMTWPDMATVPFFAGQSQAWKAKTTQVWEKYNAEYISQVKAWANANKDVKVHFVDIAKTYDHIFDNLNNFGFASLERCFDGQNICSQPSERFYWDILHPTTRTNKLIADAVAYCLGNKKRYPFKETFCL